MKPARLSRFELRLNAERPVFSSAMASPARATASDWLDREVELTARIFDDAEIETLGRLGYSGRPIFVVDDEYTAQHGALEAKAGRDHQRSRDFMESLYGGAF